MTNKYIPRDISWLSFNSRVLQEANDPTVPLASRIKFLGIFSNNLDEFFRVRVAALKRASFLDSSETKGYYYESPAVILEKITEIVIKQQKIFDETWLQIQKEMAHQNVYLQNTENLNKAQQKYVKEYFEIGRASCRERVKRQLHRAGTEEYR